MRKFAGILLAAVMLVAVLSVFAMPASAKENNGENSNSGNGNTIEVIGVCEDERGTDPGKDVKGSALSDGDLWIIVAVTVVVLGGVATLVTIKRKKRPAPASNAENKDEE